MQSAATITAMPWREPLRALAPRAPSASEWVSLKSHYPPVVIPFTASIVLVIGSPQVEPAQPRALVGGHVVATW